MGGGGYLVFRVALNGEGKSLKESWVCFYLSLSLSVYVHMGQEA
jgi:hypothetical protein